MQEAWYGFSCYFNLKILKFELFGLYLYKSTNLEFKMTKTKINIKQLEEIIREEVRILIKEAFGYGNVAPENAKEWGSDEGIGNSKPNADWTKGERKASKKDVANPIGPREDLKGESVIDDKPMKKLSFRSGTKKKK